MTITTRQNKPDGRYSDTRQRLLQKAKEAYYQKGYAGMSLQELATSVGITKAALFHHYKSKQELFLEVLVSICENYSAAIHEAIKSASDTRSRLHNILATLAHHPFLDPMKLLSDEYHQLNSEQQAQINHAFAASLELPIAQVIEEGMRNGELRTLNQQSSVAVFLNMTMLLPSPGNPAVPYMPSDQQEKYINELLDIFWGGVANPN